MFLTPQQITQTRDHTVLNFLELSSAYFEAGHRLSELMASAGRETLQHGSKHFSQLGHGQLDTMTHFPATLWLEGSTRQSRLLDNACTIISEAQKALIQSTEAQVRVLDRIIFTSINRVAKTAPWEGEIALNTMRSAMQSAELALHSISAAAVDTVELAEQEVHLVTESLTDNKPPRKRSTPRTGANKS
ncbi:MAG: hypothetical protein Q8S26_02105 [Azonexus sp.]|nr:hypothetical protein [Azonexus sp.]